MRRFWREVTIEGGAVLLDERPVRTPGRAALAIPYPRLAAAIADEWHGVEGEIDPRAMPLTGIANAAIDRIAPDLAAFAAGLAGYGESDLLYYRADVPEPLVDRQRAAWDPLLGWARARYDVHFEVTTGVIHRPQPDATVARLAEAVAVRSAFELASLSPIVTVTGSLIAALALLEEAADADTIWRATRIDEDWQAEQWGEDALAIAARDSHRADFDAAAAFLGLLR